MLLHRVEVLPLKRRNSIKRGLAFRIERVGGPDSNAAAPGHSMVRRVEGNGSRGKCRRGACLHAAQLVLEGCDSRLRRRLLDGRGFSPAARATWRCGGDRRRPLLNLRWRGRCAQLRGNSALETVELALELFHAFVRDRRARWCSRSTARIGMSRQRGSCRGSRRGIGAHRSGLGIQRVKRALHASLALLRGKLADFSGEGPRHVHPHEVER